MGLLLFIFNFVYYFCFVLEDSCDEKKLFKCPNSWREKKDGEEYDFNSVKGSVREK